MADVITYQGEPALHWFLTEPEIMWQTLKELIKYHNFRGAISEWPDVWGNEVWLFEANGHKGESVIARMGQHIIMVEGVSIIALTSEQYEGEINAS